jgi:hypothetical protein
VGKEWPWVSKEDSRCRKTLIRYRTVGTYEPAPDQWMVEQGEVLRRECDNVVARRVVLGNWLNARCGIK